MEILFDKEVKIRKPHVCFACGRKFYPPVQMRRQTHTYDGLQTVYSCKTCDELMSKFRDMFFDDCENIYPACCVHEAVIDNDVYTPEELLIQLTPNPIK